MRFRTYRQEKSAAKFELLKSSEVTRERGIKWLDNRQADWSRNLMPQVADGEFDPNSGSEVIRVSETELHVTTTGGHRLRFVVV